MRKYICPFCEKELTPNNARHIYYCEKRDTTLSKEEIRLKYIERIINGKIDDLIVDYNNLYSLPMLREKYEIDYKSILFILDMFNIKKRSIRESAKEISNAKYKKTCMERYGVDNMSKLQEIKDKKAKTFIEHYGVDNIWKTKDYTKNVWKAFSEEEKLKIIKNRYASINKNKTWGSKIEFKIIEILENLGLSYQRQYIINGSVHPYDIWLTNTKTIIEVNGRWWHADPRFYEPDDIMKQPGKKYNIKAKEIWEKDKKWFEFAKNKGYNVIILWEDDINGKDDIELTKFVIDKINE